MPRHAFSNAEIRQLLAAARAAKERDFLLLLVAYSHALRVSEVLSLKADNVRDGHLTVQRLKGSDRTTQPLVTSPDPLFNEARALVDYLRGVPSNQRLFRMSRRTADRLIKRYGAAAGLPAHKLHMHTLRHSLAAQIVDKVPINVVQKYLGHKSGASTLIYLKVDDEQASAQVGAALGSLKV